MADFITNGASELPAVKTDARSPANRNDEVKAADLNQTRQALLDLRTEAIAVSTDLASEVASRQAADTAETAARQALDQRITELEAGITSVPFTGLTSSLEVSGTHGLTSNDAAVFLPWTAPDSTVSDRNEKGIPGVGVYEANSGVGAKLAVFGGDGGRTSADEVFSWAYAKANSNQGAEFSLQTARGTFGNQEHATLKVSLIQSNGEFGHAPQASFGDQSAPPPGLLIFAQRAQFNYGGILLQASDTSVWRLLIDGSGNLTTLKVSYPSIPEQHGPDLSCTATGEGVTVYLVAYPFGTTGYETFENVDSATSGVGGHTVFSGALNAYVGESWTFYCYEQDSVQPGYKNLGGPTLDLQPVEIPDTALASDSVDFTVA